MRSNYSPVYDPSIPRSISGVWPPRYTRTAMLLDDGLTIVGYVPRPDDAFEPDSLIWTPPGVKMGPDRLGVVQDVQSAGSMSVWVRTQMDRRNRWLDMMREHVLNGRMKLTAALAKMLGLGEDAVEVNELTSQIADLDLRAGELAGATDRLFLARLGTERNRIH